MAHESYEDEEIAGVMNKHFVNIKLDREERPEIDDIYMRATVMFTRGHGGWPMSVWLTPELEPFFGGTYFPPRQRGGQPGFKDCAGRSAGCGPERKRTASSLTASALPSFSGSRWSPRSVRRGRSSRRFSISSPGSFAADSIRSKAG